MKFLALIGVGLAVLGFLGCGKGGGGQASASGPTGAQQTIDSSKPPHVKLPPGGPPSHLIVRDLHRGSGRAIPRKGGVEIRTNFVAVSYRTGKPYEVRWSPDGSFDIGFGPGLEIKGWEQGLPGMRVGGRRELFVPSKLAYGEGALLYVIDLVGVH
jgi:peptidylprolyl isomerase